MPSTVVQSAAVSVALAWAAIPGRERADRRGSETSAVGRLSGRTFQSAAAELCDRRAVGA